MVKSWKKPELIILVRNRPEENILAVCKSMLSPERGRNPGPGTIQQDCFWSPCSLCDPHQNS